MPTTYTHYRFGKEIINALPEEFKEIISSNRPLFDIGVHGPDILFYTKSPFKEHVRKTGTGLHHQSAKNFFKHSAKVIKKAGNKKAAKAYIYGFITHFVLDSESHKYVEKMIHESGVGHNEIEAEFDAYLLKKDKYNPITYNRTIHIQPSMKRSRVIAPFFNNIYVKGVTKKNPIRNVITAGDINETIASQIIVHNILSPKTPLGKKLLHLATELTGDEKESIRGLVINEKANPICTQYNYILENIYSEAIPITVKMIMQFEEFLMGNKTLPSRFDRTYDEGDDWESVELYGKINI